MDIDVGTAWRAGVITAVGGTVAAVSGALIALGASNDAGRGYLMRGAVMLVVIVATTVILAARSVRLDLRQTFAPSVLFGSLVGFVVDPGMWSGRGFVAQVLLGAGPLAAVVDLLALLALTAASVLTLGSRLLRESRVHDARNNAYVTQGIQS